MPLLGRIEETIVVLSAAGSDAAAATSVFEFFMPHAAQLIAIRFECDQDNPPTGSAAQLDINKNGTTILSTKATIDAGEYSSTTAATPYAFSSSPISLADGDRLEFDIDQVGSTNAGQEYKCVLIWIRG